MAGLLEIVTRFFSELWLRSEPSRNSGFLIQSRHGRKGNFELVLPSQLGGAKHCWRDNDTEDLSWNGPNFFGSSDITATSLIQSNFGNSELGHLEVVALSGQDLYHYWRSDEQPYSWFGPTWIASGAAGNPALIQSRFGDKGNFELVFPRVDGGLAHYWRDNDDAALRWVGPSIFGESVGVIEGVALIQSNFGTPGNLEVIANVQSGFPHWLAHFWRESDPPFRWSSPTQIPLGDALPSPGTQPGLIQSRHGDRGNFEVVYVTKGSLAHLWRDNDDAALPWIRPTRFGTGEFRGVSVIQSNFGKSIFRTREGNLEVAAIEGGQGRGRAAIYWRQGEAPWQWSDRTASVCDEPTCDSTTEGEWRVRYTSRIVGIHAALLRTGRVLFYTYREEDKDNGESSVLDPVTGDLTRLPLDRDPFCAGQTMLADGRVLVAGGSGGSSVRSLHTFSPAGAAGAWQYLGDMADGRWYPTCTTLPDGRVFIVGGSGGGGGPAVSPEDCSVADKASVNATYEVFDPRAGLGPPQPAPILSASAPYSLYPFVFVLPSGKLLIHSGNRTRFLDLGTWTFDALELRTLSPTARTYPSQGSCVLLPLLPDSRIPYHARVMVIGGAGVSCPERATLTTSATNKCEILDLEATPLAWGPAAAMTHSRVMPDAVLLPDGTVLVVGGSSTGVADAAISPVFQAELYQPADDSWTTLCSMRVARLYHATALLLPDGRVLTAGGGEEFNAPPFEMPEYRVEVFSPPYLFRGPRPFISSAPSSMAYDRPYTIGTREAASIASAALVAPGAVTHSFNMNQRYAGLVISGRVDGQSIEVISPPNSRIAPPGWYMLFLLSNAGVPSLAEFVHLG